MESIPTSCINFSFILFLLTLPAVFRCVAASLTQPRKRISPPPFGGYCYCPMGSARIIYKCLLHSFNYVATYLLEHPLLHNRSIDGLDHLALAVVSEVIQVMLLEND